MSTLTGRAGTALLVVDVQVDVVAGAHDRDGVVARIASLVDRARREGCPVVWVRHNDDELPAGSPGWCIVDGLVPGPDEPVMDKRFGDAFEDTDLDRVLGGLDVSRLVVCGAQTEWCIRSTLHGAVARGYDAVLVTDAHTTSDASHEGVDLPASAVIALTNRYWGWHSVPGRSTDAVAAAAVALTP
jgi:nicotinamidase-related amidase